MTKLVVIGIDGFDPILVEKWKDKLPNLSQLREKGDQIKYESIFPYDSVPLWASIYTGVTPAEHGILGSPINFLEKDYSSDINVDFVRGKTFWDYSSSNGKKVCVINPFLAYPPWKVNGIMASGSVFNTDLPQKVFPSNLNEKFNIPYLGGVLSYTGYPTKENLNLFKEKIYEMTSNQADFSLRLLKDNNWDLFFTCFITLDGLQHFFWRYCSEDDPTYPGENSYKYVILDIYKKFDEMIGRFKRTSPDSTFIILSDHGFGTRCIKLANVNELLRKNNLLFSKDKKSGYTEMLKFKIFDLVHKTNTVNLALKIAKKIPKITRNAQKSTNIVNMTNTVAYAADLTGMNPCGGINIIKENLMDLDYEDVRTLIIEKLEQWEDSGDKIVKWASRREDLYSGTEINEFPDIIFELKEEYGVNWAIGTPLVINAYTHKAVSGGHRKNAFLLIENLNGKKLKNNENANTLDIAPTILDILNIDYKKYDQLEGISLLE
ncbi:MAG: alkaline phosphatase family protein [Methanobacterium sp.]|jgi:predicted AlkP superfamily phosphohydrolase/phosphomutase